MYDYGWFKSILVQYCTTKLLCGCEIEMTGDWRHFFDGQDVTDLCLSIKSTVVGLYAAKQLGVLSVYCNRHLSSSNRVDPMTFEKHGTCTCFPMICLSEFGCSTGKAGHSSESVTFRNPQRLGGGIFHWTSFRRSFELRCDFLVSCLNSAAM